MRAIFTFQIWHAKPETVKTWHAKVRKLQIWHAKVKMAHYNNLIERGLDTPND